MSQVSSPKLLLASLLMMAATFMVANTEPVNADIHWINERVACGPGSGVYCEKWICSGGGDEWCAQEPCTCYP